MGIKFTRIAAVMVAIMLVCLGFAQGGGQGRRGGGMFGGGPGSPPALLALFRQDVQADLALTDDQKTKISDLRTSMRPAQGAPRPTPEEMATRMADMAKKLNDILTPEQQKRIVEIYVQINGSHSVVNKEIGDQVGLTADQSTQIKALSEKMNAANRELITKVQNQEMTREDAATAREKNSKTFDEEIDKILTADQKTKLEAMKGTKKFEAQTPQPRGGG